MKSRECLVLNADFRPLQTYPLALKSGRDAVEAVLRGRVMVVDEWEEAYRSPSVEIRIPKVLALREYAPINARPKFCRMSVFLRDRFVCQYCGKRFPIEQLTFEHVVPRAKGGQTVWENILTACMDCNGRKMAQDANWSGRKGKNTLRPLKPPRQPSTMELLRAGLEFLDPVKRETWGDWLYWSSELHA